MKKILLTIAAFASFCAAQVITPTNAGRQGRYEVVSIAQDYAAAMTSVSVRGSAAPSFAGAVTVYGKMNYGCCSAPNWIYFWSSKAARDVGDTSASSVIASVRSFSEATGARTITLNPRHAGTDTIILTFVNTPALSSTGDNPFDLLFMNANSETMQGQIDTAMAPLFNGTADLSVNSVEANGYTFPPSTFGLDGNCDECLQVTYPGKSSPYFYVEGSGIGLTGLKNIQADVASFGTIIATDTSWNLSDSVLHIVPPLIHDSLQTVVNSFTGKYFVAFGNSWVDGTYGFTPYSVFLSQFLEADFVNLGKGGSWAMDSTESGRAQATITYDTSLSTVLSCVNEIYNNAAKDLYTGPLSGMLTHTAIPNAERIGYGSVSKYGNWFTRADTGVTATGTVGDSIKFSCTGTSCVIAGVSSTWANGFTVYVDGVNKGVYSQTLSGSGGFTNTNWAYTSWVVGGLTNATHTVKLVSLGRAYFEYGYGGATPRVGPVVALSACPYLAYHGYGSGSAAKVTQFRAAEDSIVTALNGAGLNILHVIAQPDTGTQMATDGTHPNVAGAVLIADSNYAALSRIDAGRVMSVKTAVGILADQPTAQSLFGALPITNLEVKTLGVGRSAGAWPLMIKGIAYADSMITPGLLVNNINSGTLYANTVTTPSARTTHLYSDSITTPAILATRLTLSGAASIGSVVTPSIDATHIYAGSITAPDLLVTNVNVNGQLYSDSITTPALLVTRIFGSPKIGPSVGDQFIDIYSNGATNAATAFAFHTENDTIAAFIAAAGSSYPNLGGPNSFNIWNRKPGPIVFATNNTIKGTIDVDGMMDMVSYSADGEPGIDGACTKARYSGGLAVECVIP